MLGCACLYFAVKYIQNMLYGVPAFDPARAATGCVLKVVALVAGLIPALRPASSDPIRALRAE